MRLIARIVAGLIVIAAVVVGGAYLLPANVSVARSVVIDAAPEAVFPYLTDFRRFYEWSPWTDRDPDMVVEYEGAPSGVGAVMRWDSADQNVGTGRQEITLVEEFSRVESSLDFGGMGTSTALFELAPRAEGDATEVTWGFTADLGLNPAMRYIGLMMDRWVGADYEAGLANLKAMVEAASASGLTAGPAEPAGDAPAE